MVYSPWGCQESDTTEQLSMWAHIPFRVGFVAHFNHKVSEVKVAQSCPSHVQLFGTPWTIQSMKFSRTEYWIG